MKTSCGTILINENNEILGCHGTGRAWFHGTYDIPKGEQVDNEAADETALREMQEETGLSYANSEMKDLGLFKYLPDKNLHLFSVKVSSSTIELSQLKCSSYFERNGKQLPEVNGYKWINQNELDWFYPNLSKVLKLVLTDRKGR